MMGRRLESEEDLREMVDTMERELCRLKDLGDCMALVFLGLRATLGHVISAAEQECAMARSLSWPSRV
jgi:hypothetical protein